LRQLAVAELDAAQDGPFRLSPMTDPPDRHRYTLEPRAGVRVVRSPRRPWLRSGTSSRLRLRCGFAAALGTPACERLSPHPPHRRCRGARPPPDPSGSSPRPSPVGDTGLACQAPLPASRQERSCHEQGCPVRVGVIIRSGTLKGYTILQ
jgi:hypothetical protein